MNKIRGFSLVELSIVLIIIGLLVAGVSGGSKLIQNAKIGKLINEIAGFQNSYNIFILTYDMPPGDFTEAQNYWGTSGVTNGNGDGKIVGEEMSGALVHLTKAELVNNSIDSNGYYILKSFPDASVRLLHQSAGGFTYAKTGNLLLIGKDSYAQQPYLLPEQSYKVDKKIDDALPKSGIMTYRASGESSGVEASCTNSSTSYFLSSKVVGCNSAITLGDI